MASYLIFPTAAFIVRVISNGSFLSAPLLLSVCLTSRFQIWWQPKFNPTEITCCWKHSSHFRHRSLTRQPDLIFVVCGLFFPVQGLFHPQRERERERGGGGGGGGKNLPCSIFFPRTSGLHEYWPLSLSADCVCEGRVNPYSLKRWRLLRAIGAELGRGVVFHRWSMIVHSGRKEG